VTRKIGYRWHLRRLMAERGMYATTELVPLLAERGIGLSREQVYRLVVHVPERLSLPTLAALCDILDCQPGDLVEPVAQVRPARKAPSPPAQLRPRRARVLPEPGPEMATATPVRCDAGHEGAHGGGRVCPRCRRDRVVALTATAEASLPVVEVAAAVDTVATSPAVLRSLAQALEGDAETLRHGAPPVVTRLVVELIGRGSTTLTSPTCTVCGRVGQPLTRTDRGGMCKRCAQRRLVAGCVRCGVAKPVAGRTADGQPICERCRRHERGQRPCGRCGNTASIAARARDGEPDVCVNCYRLPEADCSVCGRRRRCTFADTDAPICKTCMPRPTRCGTARPPAVRWPEGPLCDPCYTAALRRRAACAGCGQQRRLVAPPGANATTCADCAGLPVTHACDDCGVEDKLYEKGRCARCSLHRRAHELLSDHNGQIPAGLTGVFHAITAARTPRSALNWLRKGAGAGLLAELTAGRLAATHQALDAHPRRPAADYLRHILTTHGVLAPRDEALARTERWLATLLASIDRPEHRRILATFATWQAMRRLRRTAQTNPQPRTATAHARARITAGAALLAWLHARDRPLADCRQADIEDWLTTGPGASHARDFLVWAAEHHHCDSFDIPRPPRTTGASTDPDQRWALVARLLHDDNLDVTDRVAGSLVLLFGQQQSRIAAMTTDQISHHDDTVHIRFGRHEVPVPEPLGALLDTLVRHGRSHVGVGSPTATQWLFPGGLPGRPITPARLADRLRALGIPTQAARRAALIDLAAKLPAAILAELLDLHPTTAVHWTRQATSDWSRYAAEIAHDRNHQT